MSGISELPHCVVWIADIGVKSSVWLVLALLLLWVLRGQSAAARHRVCLIALGGLPLLPLLHGLPPAWRVPVSSFRLPLTPALVREWQGRSERGQRKETLRDAPAVKYPADTLQTTALETTAAQTTGGVLSLDHPAERPQIPVVENYRLSGLRPSVLRTREADAKLRKDYVRVFRESTQPSRLISGAHLPLVLAGVWMTGFVLVMLRNLGSWRALHRLGCASAPVPAGRLADALTLGVRECGNSKRRIRLQTGGQTPGFAAPMTWGWLRPVVWLPDGAEDWMPERVRVVLLHEIAHIQRGDWLWQTLTACLCAVYWFHPLVWLLNRRLHSESERACDDCVLQAGVPAACYAQHLLEVAQTLKSLRNAPAAAVTMARSSQIETRLRAILAAQDISRSPRSQMRARFAAFALPVTLVPLSAAQLTASARQTTNIPPASLVRLQEPQARSVRTATQTLPSLPSVIPRTRRVPSTTASVSTSVGTSIESGKARLAFSGKTPRMPVLARKSSAPPRLVSLPGVSPDTKRENKAKGENTKDENAKDEKTKDENAKGENMEAQEPTLQLLKARLLGIFAPAFDVESEYVSSETLLYLLTARTLGGTGGPLPGGCRPQRQVVGTDFVLVLAQRLAQPSRTQSAAFGGDLSPTNRRHSRP